MTTEKDDAAKEWREATARKHEEVLCDECDEDLEVCDACKQNLCDSLDKQLIYCGPDGSHYCEACYTKKTKEDSHD